MHKLKSILALLMFVAVGLAAAAAVVALPQWKLDQPAQEHEAAIASKSPAGRHESQLLLDTPTAGRLPPPSEFSIDERDMGPLPGRPPVMAAPVVPAQNTAGNGGPPALPTLSELRTLLPESANQLPAADANAVSNFPAPPPSPIDPPAPAANRAQAPQPMVTAPSFPGEGDGKLDIVIPDTEIREVLELLSKAGGLNILASRNVTGQVKASLTGVSAETALSAILKSAGYTARREGDFVYVGTAEDFVAMDQAIDRIGTRVYRPNYVSAAELQRLITPMLSAVGSISVNSPSEVGIASNQNSAGGDNFAGAEVVVVHDFEGVLAQIDQVFDEVDRRPLQVSIEAMILSVKLTDELTLGVDWELLRNKEHIRLVFGSPPQSLDGLDIANNSGLKVAFLDSSVSALLDALEKIGETHVISSPRLMCLNKQRAEIHIGEERGYVSTTVTETASTQSVEFLEVGTQLRLRPFISNDGMIRLEIHPELSTGTVEVSDNFTLPRKNVTQVTTNVMVRDGATLVIGGLLREDLNMDTSQIPLLGSLPFVGPAFRNKIDKTTRDEVVVIVTPRIVWEPRFNCEGEYADCEGHQQHAIFADKMSHVSTVYFGRRYRRLAKAAWVAGDAKSALRFANMSIQFNPLDRQTVQIRSEIIANSPYGDKTVDCHLRQGLYPWLDPLKAYKYPNWVLDELQGPNTAVGQEPAPYYNPGTPGYRSDIFIPVVPNESGEAVERLPEALPLPIPSEGGT